MVVNVTADLRDLNTVIDDVKFSLVIHQNDCNNEHRTGLCGALCSFKDSLEQELLKYDDSSYEAFEITKTILRITNVLEEVESHA